MTEFEKNHLIGELATHKGYSLLIDQLEVEFQALDNKLADSVESNVDMSLLAQWKAQRKMLKRLRAIPKQSLATTKS